MEGTRQHPRVDYRAHVLLLGAEEPGPDTQPILGRSVNLSASGVLVEADHACPIGRELACLIPLNGRTRTLRARVARVQPMADHRVGIGMAFLELSAPDRALLQAIVAGEEPPSEVVSVRFDGVAQPLQSRAVITDDGIELRTALPFLRLESEVEVAFGTGGGRVVRKGVLREVRVERGMAAPYLAVAVEIRKEPASVPDERDAEPALEPEPAPVSVVPPRPARHR
jgi:hypothetical protein